MDKQQPATIRYYQRNNDCTGGAHRRYTSDLSQISRDFLGKEPQKHVLDDISSVYSKKSQNQSGWWSKVEEENQQTVLVASINELISKNYERLSKHERIRINQWMAKLSIKQINPVWRKNAVFYLKVLAEMLRQNKISGPFHNLPEDGPLPKLTLYDLPYPLREKFSQSKEQTHSKSTKKELKSSESVNIVQKISVLKGHDFSSNSFADSKKTSLNMISKKISSFQLQNQFQADSFQMSIATRPQISNHKTRKQQIQKWSSNRVCGGKQNKNSKFIGSKKVLQQSEDKENDPNIINRQLFKSKQKKYQQNSYPVQEIKHQGARKKNNENANFGYNIESQESQESQEYSEVGIFSKMYKILQNNQQTLIEQPQYGSLLQELQFIGKKLNLPQFHSHQDQILSQSSQAFLKASQSLKSKFSQTDSQTIQFMHFLRQHKSKDVNIPVKHYL